MVRDDFAGTDRSGFLKYTKTDGAYVAYSVGGACIVLMNER